MVGCGCPRTDPSALCPTQTLQCMVCLQWWMVCNDKPNGEKYWYPIKVPSWESEAGKLNGD